MYLREKKNLLVMNDANKLLQSIYFSYMTPTNSCKSMAQLNILLREWNFLSVLKIQFQIPKSCTHLFHKL